MKKYLLVILCILPLVAFSQEVTDKKYLAGAVPMVDGKVTFTKEWNVPGLSKGQIYDIVLKWAQKRFITDKDSNGRILYQNKEKGQIACSGEEYIVFSDKRLALDRTRIYYRPIFFCSEGKCKMEISNISFDYSVYKERLMAEEWITDKDVLSKDQTKLLPKIAKFRIKTIDFVEDLTDELQGSLGIVPIKTPVRETVAVTSEPLPEVPVSFSPAISQDTPATSALAGYKSISPDRIPGNVIRLLSDSWSLITAGEGNSFNMMTASWGGLGYLYNKPVSFCFISPSRYTYQLMEKGDTYTISFYTETYREALQYCGTHSGKEADKVQATGLTPIQTPSGSRAFSEAWMIIECKKTVNQSFTPEAIADPVLKQEWEGKPMHKMYIGEIINVWVK